MPYALQHNVPRWMLGNECLQCAKPCFFCQCRFKLSLYWDFKLCKLSATKGKLAVSKLVDGPNFERERWCISNHVSQILHLIWRKLASRQSIMSFERSKLGSHRGQHHSIQFALMFKAQRISSLTLSYTLYSHSINHRAVFFAYIHFQEAVVCCVAQYWYENMYPE